MQSSDPIHEPQASPRIYAGLFLVTLATLLYEFLLTRIFSVTMGYHFAFLVVSLAMLGLGAGAMLVHVFPGYFSRGSVERQLSYRSLSFAASIPIAFLIHSNLSQARYGVPYGTDPFSAAVILTYITFAVPFVFSGIAVCLALTHYPKNIGKMYAADLCGAATGCLLLPIVLEWMNGPKALLGAAIFAAAGAVCFAARPTLQPAPPRRNALWLLIPLAALFVLAARSPLAWFDLPGAKGHTEAKPIYEKWNSYSRVRVHGDPGGTPTAKPFDYATSSAYPDSPPVLQYYIGIDSDAATWMSRFDGDTGKLGFLQFTIDSIPHRIRSDADVLVIGAGGGKDILTALAYDQKSVTAIEVNRGIAEAVNGVFGDFTGHLDRHPKVTFAEDEARSYIARSDKKYDIITSALVDTWAATAAGAYVLSENSLYTVEAWKLFLSRLNDNGVIAFSRWHDAQIYRLAALAYEAMRESGIAEPRRHAAIIKADKLSLLIVCKNPFSPGDLDRLRQAAVDLKFDLVLTPEASSDPELSRILSTQDHDAAIASNAFNISPPTDNRPFFFNLMRPRDAFGSSDRIQHNMSLGVHAFRVLIHLLLLSWAFAILCIGLPCLLAPARTIRTATVPASAYFALIGLGFMLVEISQMQRLTIFLGHPTYSIFVTLFVLLISSGAGSWSVERMEGTGRAGTRRLASLLAALLVYGAVMPFAIGRLESFETVFRILFAAVMLFPLGFTMGAAFPIGIKAVRKEPEAPTSWYWGINSAVSVCGAVLAVVGAHSFGIAASYWAGFACYAIASAIFLKSRLTRP